MNGVCGDDGFGVPLPRGGGLASMSVHGVFVRGGGCRIESLREGEEHGRWIAKK